MSDGAADLTIDGAAMQDDEPEDARHLSPTALNRFLACEHRTYLDLRHRRGELDSKPAPPPMDLLLQRGQSFEIEVLADLEREIATALDLAEGSREERAARTVEAMRAGEPVIYQGCFLVDDWLGYPDFLIRVDEPSPLLGAWSYEVHDAKFGSTARPNHIFQLLFYTDAIERIQGVRPQRMHLVLGSGERPAFAPDDFAAYAANVRATFEHRYAQLAGSEPDPVYPYPVGACEFCHWWHVCADRRREDDHLSLVANLHRGQGLKLEAADVHSLPALADLPADQVVARVARSTLDVLRDQAALQRESRGLDVPLHRTLMPAHDRGLGRLPAPSEGDVHFDFEGDQFFEDAGLEYLWGTLHLQDGEWHYRPIWAHDYTQERAAFEEWIDWITARLERYPDLHVFHFNSYEVVALKRLQARYATREHELDELLRRNVFVDLYGITRQAVRVGTERYGLKFLEPAYGFERNAELQGAIGSMREWQAFGEDGDEAHLRRIALYNRDDVLSTAELFDWLRSLRGEAESVHGVELATLEPEKAKELTPAARELLEKTDALRERLLAGLSDDTSSDTHEDLARRRAFDLVGYHAREAKPGWWSYFARREMTLEQLRDEDPEAIAELEVLETIDDKNAWIWRLHFPEQNFKLSPGGVDDPIARSNVELLELDEGAGTVLVRRTKKRGDEAPVALAPGGPFNTSLQRAAVFTFAERAADDGLDRAEAGLDLLLRRTPRFVAGTPELTGGPVEIPRLARQVLGLDRSALVIQGPPGTGKTYTGARLALALMAEGKKVGVTATSHKAINNFLRAIDDAAGDEGAFRAWRGWRKKSDEPDNCYSDSRVVCTKKLDETEGEVLLRAGTAWYWSNPGEGGEVDVLFVDEAGQVSLADAIAVAAGARSVVLLGDPQQLAHVSQGTHLHGSGASVLEHMLGDDDTIPPDRGVLLEQSWRMHPDVCGFVSQTMYDGRLHAEPDCALQCIEGPSPLVSGTGLRMLGVTHSDNRGRSIEEADAIEAEYRALLRDGWYVDRKGERHRITAEDVLVVAPYNAQVRCLKARLGEDARVGTVDKFQGQEAPVVFFSMTSSTGDDVSRGMSFLFSRNRLNVAISRAQSLAVVVCSPALLHARCSTVEDMRLVNLLCRVAEAASALAR